MAKFNDNNVFTIIRTEDISESVEANPQGEPTEHLEKIRIDNVIYDVATSITTADINALFTNGVWLNGEILRFNRIDTLWRQN